MKFPLTYYVRYEYKNEEYSLQFSTDIVLTQELIEHEVERVVLHRFGRSFDPSKIFVKSYNYEESD